MSSEIDLIEAMLLADLVTELPHAVRLQRLVASLRASFSCGAVALLKLEDEGLRPVAVDGLVREALGRRFMPAHHPRLAAILARRDVTTFDHDSALPDPYDGLLDSHVGAPLPVHDCMGVSLHVDGQSWGVLTLDALRTGTFGDAARDRLRRYTVFVETALRVTRLEQDVHALRISRSSSDRMSGAGLARGAEEIIGQSAVVTDLLRELEVVAESDLPVLLLGETGVGKELFARYLHRRSPRADRPLVHVNCAALPESVAESELFGHVKGAFSGATTDRPGRFDAADGGTLFLDEVGELPLSIQAKLLRVLQNGEIQRLGTDQPRRVDTRIIAATNRNLGDSVREGLFRADLYHRLSVYPAPIPPLRERGADVLVLAGYFLELNRARLGLRSLRLTRDAEEALCAYRWPGNVRELEHAISRAALKMVSRGAQRSEIVSIPASALDIGHHQPGGGPADVLAGDEAGEPGIRPLRLVTDAAQRAHLRRALQASSGNWAQAARLLELDPSNLHKLARRLGLK